MTGNTDENLRLMLTLQGGELSEDQVEDQIEDAWKLTEKWVSHIRHGENFDVVMNAVLHLLATLFETTDNREQLYRNICQALRRKVGLGH
jgi:hypothetical protein